MQRHGFIAIDPASLKEDDIVAYAKEDLSGWTLGKFFSFQSFILRSTSIFCQ